MSAQPDVDDSDVAEALEGFANPALSGSVTLVFDKKRVRLTPAEFAPVLDMKARQRRAGARPPRGRGSSGSSGAA